MHLSRTDKHCIHSLVLRLDPARVTLKIIEERRWELSWPIPNDELLGGQDDVREVQVRVHAYQITGVESLREGFHAETLT